MNDQEMTDLLAEITRRIREVSDPEQIILFGSRARGDSRPDSDVDLLIIKDNIDSTRAEAGRIYRALSHMSLPIDVIVVRPAYVELYKDIIGTIVRPALREGKVLYAR
ncbi:MAG: nucleotidyltransferase domain-containing protein [Roseiflexaceae bacterium]